MRRFVNALLATALLCAGLAALAAPAGATTFSVTNGADSGSGSFSAAVADAAADDTGPHVIEIDPGLVIEQTATEPLYNGTQPLTINGNGSTITASGGSFRLLIVVAAADVTVNDLTMTNTATVTGGGAVFHNGTGNLTINDAVISNHTGTNGTGAIRGVKVESTLTINRSTIGGNSSTNGAGGAINQAGPLVVTDSSFVQNEALASSGGAIAALDDVSIDRSYFTRNNTKDTGGALYAQTGGTSTTITNSTFIDNDTVGTFISGAAIGAGNLQIDQSTFAENDGAAAGVIQVAFFSGAPENNSITRSVLLAPGSDDKNCGGSLLRATGFTYSTDASCTGSGGAATGDVENGADPLLGQVRDNGGPTPTMFPLAGSPLVDAIPLEDCSQTFDQREVARPFPAGGACDIGATEAVFPAHSQTGVTPFYEATVRWVTSPVNTPQILSGFNDGSFGQSLSITRGQAARLYYNGAGAPDVSGLPFHGFSDGTPFFNDAITWAKDEGLFNGYPDNTFRPNNPINRGNFIRSLHAFAGSQNVDAEPDHPFTDVTPFYENAVKWAKARGLADGFPDNTFRQNDDINRGNASRTFYNTAQSPAAWDDTMVAPPNMLFRNNLVG